MVQPDSLNVGRSAATREGCGARCPHAGRQPTPAPRPARVRVACPPSRAGPAPAVRQHRDPEHALLPLQARQSAVVVLLVRAPRPALDAEALRHYIAEYFKERGTTAEWEVQAERPLSPWQADARVE